MTLTFELDTVTVNQHTKYLYQRCFVLNLMSRHTHPRTHNHTRTPIHTRSVYQLL